MAAIALVTIRPAQTIHQQVDSSHPRDSPTEQHGKRKEFNKIVIIARDSFICLWYYIKSSKHMNCTCWFEHHRREFATLSFNVTTNQPTCSWKRLAWMVSSRMLRGLMWKDLTHNLMRSLGWMVVERVTFSTRFASCWESRTCNRCEKERCIFNTRDFDRFNSFHYFDARFERIAYKSSYTSKGKLGSPRQRFPSCLTTPTRRTVLLDMNTWTKLLWQGNLSLGGGASIWSMGRQQIRGMLRLCGFGLFIILSKAFSVLVQESAKFVSLCSVECE